jgi:endonuclease-3
MPDAAARARTARIARLLRGAYGPRPRRKRGSAVDTLVGTILSQNTSDANSSAGFRRLKGRFGSWDAVADAPASAIERAIRVSGLSRRKAPRIRRILRQIREDRGRISLAFLSRRPVEEALEYLLRFDGVGPKTALCVLLFGFGKAVFPVDTHIHRVARRLGLIGERVPPARAHEMLTPMIAPKDRHALHVLLIAHGRRTCRPRSPRCRSCVLLALCPEGARRLGRPRPRRRHSSMA